MTEPAAEPLPAGWAPNVDALGAQWSGLPAEARSGALLAAVRTLWALSGRRFGTIELTLAPYILPPHVGWYDGTRHRVTLNAARGYATGGLTACAPARTFRLPGPVVSVAEVVVDAVVLPADAWALDPDGTLVRVDGGDWPVAQDVYAPRWVVRYVRGIPADGPANTAAALYALELARGAAEALWTTHWADGVLRRTSRGGAASEVAGFAEDYGAVASGFAHLAGALGDASWLRRAMYTWPPRPTMASWALPCP